MDGASDARRTDAAAIVEEYLASDLCDGLPVLPPTAENVAAMVAAMGRTSDTVVGTVPPGDVEATVGHVAANAVLAGCRPEYGPVVLAAVEAMLADRFALYGVACSTKGAAPLAIVSGPIRERIGMNARGNVFGHGVRANATIGRALRLILQNVAKAVPGVLDRATLGHPGKYSYCIAEDEEDSPWEPLHVERGMTAGQSAVTMLGCEAPRQVSVQDSSPEAILSAVAYTVASAAVGSGVEGRRNAPQLVAFAKEHRDILREASWTKAEVKKFIADGARVPAEVLEKSAGSVAGPVRAVTSEDDLLVIAAGGPVGRFSSVCPGWTWQSRPVTVSIE
ncbi:MAG: hypothetical protein ACRDN9_00410 [Streptosporangiaceae bacterium]